MNSQKSLFISLLSLSLVWTASCGKRDAAPAAGLDVVESSIIVGSLDWEEVTTLKSQAEEKRNASAVAHVDLPAMGSRCTGFLIKNNILMTNHHCIPTESHARGVTVSFNVVEGVPKGQEERFDCSEFIGNNQELDFALLKCTGNPGQKYGVVELSEESFSGPGDVYVIQQNCDYYTDRNCYYTKKISFGSGALENGSLTHDADTLGGSSGSPVFSGTSHKVVAIHHAGLGNNGLGRGVENYAVPMDKIVSYITSNFPQVGLGSGPIQQDPPSKNNDTFEGAGTLSLNKVLKGSISSASDVDYFKFKLNSTSSIRIVLKIDGSQDLDLYVFSSQEKLLAKSESVTSTESIAGTASAGEYYVLVKGYKGATGGYRLEVEK